MKPELDQSPLLGRIAEAIRAHKRPSIRLHVSVAPEPKWENSRKGDRVLVRWVCWNLEEGGSDVTAPSFEVVSELVTQEQLAAELPQFFPETNVVVDDDIEV